MSLKLAFQQWQRNMLKFTENRQIPLYFHNNTSSPWTFNLRRRSSWCSELWCAAQVERFKISGDVVTTGCFPSLKEDSNLLKRTASLDSFHSGLCGLFSSQEPRLHVCISCLWGFCGGLCCTDKIRHRAEVLITSARSPRLIKAF